MRSNSQFDEIEKLLKSDIKALYKGNNAYIYLVQKMSDCKIEYLIGMFTPIKTPVPDGYEMIYFQNSKLAVCHVYGKSDLIINYDKECRRRLLGDIYLLSLHGLDRKRKMADPRSRAFFKEI
jgi:hypothetical protein